MGELTVGCRKCFSYSFWPVQAAVLLQVAIIGGEFVNFDVEMEILFAQRLSKLTNSPWTNLVIVSRGRV